MNPRSIEESPRASPSADVVIEARGLSKNFGAVRAVQSVSFEVHKGEVFGIFGPNGAGKSTSIRMLCGLTPPSSGEAIVAGYDVRQEPTELRRHLSIVPEEFSFYEKMTPQGYLRFFSRMAGHTSETAEDKIARVAEVAEVSDFLRKRIADLSHGQRQRVTLARAFLSEVPILFMDEPFQGIDIVHRKALREYIRGFVSQANTVFFTSHNLIEAEHIVDRFAFIDKGTILKIGTARELRDRYLLPSYAIRTSDPSKAQRVLSEGLATTECTVMRDEVVVTLKDAADVPKVSVLLGEAGIALMEMRQLGTMEEVFLRMRTEGST
jgi:ABC-type multidrug transport system ATPase subunit